MRVVLPTLAVAVFVAVVWLLLGSDERSDRSGDPARATTGTGVDGQAPARGPGTSAQPGEVAAEREEVRQDAPEAGIPELAPDAPPAGISGRIVVVDESGVEHRAESGTLTIMLWTGNRGTEGDPVPVRDGSFVLPATEGDGVQFRTATLGDRSVVLEQDRFALPVANLELRGRWPRPTTLRVIDATTRRDLSDVTVVHVRNWREDEATHPGTWSSERALVESGVSPLALDRPQQRLGRSDQVLVGAGGYAWASTHLDFDAGGTHLVELLPGADLTVELQGSLPTNRGRDRPQVRLRRPAAPRDFPSLDAFLERLRDAPASEFPGGVRWTDEEARLHHAQLAERVERLRGPVVLFDVARDDAPMTWRGLPTGDFSVSIEVGDHWDDPLVLGSSPVTLRAGQETRATVTLSSPPSAELVPLAGTLFFPPEWGDMRLVFRLEPQDLKGASSSDDISLDLKQMQPVASTPGLYRWDAGRVHPGGYVVQSYALEYQDYIETGPQGRSDAAITIAPPADVVVDLRDRFTGLPVPGVTLHWNCKRPARSSGGSLGSATWDSASQTYGFRAPAVPVELSAFGDDIEIVDVHLLELRPGANAFTLHAVRVATVELELREDGRLVHFPHEWFWDLTVTAVGGAGTGRAGRASETRGTIRFSEPGLYEITVPELPGYAPIAPFRIGVPGRQSIEHVLEVTRSDGG